MPETDRTTITFGQTTINGVSHTNAMIMSLYSGTGEVQLNAGRSRGRFLGDLGIPDDQRSSTGFHVEISLDNGPAVFTTDVAFGQTKRVDLDVTNVLRIKIRFTRLDRVSDDADLAIGSPRFG